jgi:hypothetical protein
LRSFAYVGGYEVHCIARRLEAEAAGDREQRKEQHEQHEAAGEPSDEVAPTDTD